MPQPGGGLVEAAFSLGRAARRRSQQHRGELSVLVRQASGFVELGDASSRRRPERSECEFRPEADHRVGVLRELVECLGGDRVASGRPVREPARQDQAQPVGPVRAARNAEGIRPRVARDCLRRDGLGQQISRERRAGLAPGRSPSTGGRSLADRG